VDEDDARGAATELLSGEESFGFRVYRDPLYNANWANYDFDGTRSSRRCSRSRSAAWSRVAALARAAASVRAVALRARPGSARTQAERNDLGARRLAGRPIASSAGEEESGAGAIALPLEPRLVGLALRTACFAAASASFRRPAAR